MLLVRNELAVLLIVTWRRLSEADGIRISMEAFSGISNSDGEEEVLLFPCAEQFIWTYIGTVHWHKNKHTQT